MAQGTPKTTCLVSLSQTAYNHSYYLSQNTDVGISHEEEPGRRGFTGVTLGDRADYTGIDRTAFWLNEGIGGGEKPGEILSEHLRSVYHRSHLLSPGTKYVGLANDVINSLTWMDINGIKASYYPYSGMVDVELAFEPDTETPNPWFDREVIGTPISIHFPRYLSKDSDEESKVVITKFIVYENGSPLQGRILTSSSDSNVQPNDAFFLPMFSLTADSWYDVDVKASYGMLGFEQNWSFRTR